MGILTRKTWVLLLGLISSTGWAYTSNWVTCSDANQKLKTELDFLAEQVFEQRITFNGKVVYELKGGVVSTNLYRFSAVGAGPKGMPSSSANGHLLFYDLRQATVSDPTTGEVLFSDLMLCNREIGGGKYQAN